MGNKIKYQGGITKFLCMKLAERNKAKFCKSLSENNFLSITNANKVNFDVISFSGAFSFEDQLLSIYSFVFYAGIPNNWIIYSDKTYTERHKNVFKKKFPFITILDWDIYNFTDNSVFSEFLGVWPLAKKLNIIMGHNYQSQTLYFDSDIIFYKNMADYLNSKLLDSGFWYASDPMWGDVSQYFSVKRESLYPLNSGLLILNKDFNTKLIFEYLENLKGDYQYFSEQLSFEYAFRKQNANMLDPRQFIINSKDQFDFSTLYKPADIAMRHYTTPVRHKMWQYGWRWHFDK